MRELLQIDPADNVAVALWAIPRGHAANGLRVTDDVPAGHKVALRPIRQSEPVLKFGYPIGVATRDIAPGEHVHVQNVASCDGAGMSRRRTGPLKRARLRCVRRGATFEGFRRPDGAPPRGTRSGSSTPSAA